MHEAERDERRWRRRLAGAGVLVLAALLRLPFLDWKPPHVDEGVNGWFVDQIFSLGYFDYNPENFHGPLHFYLLQLSVLLFGRNIIALRLVAVIASLLTVLVMLRHRRFIGRAALWAALAFAISPAATFYARYAIHESELTLFLVLGSYGWLSWRQAPSRWALAALVTSAVGILATKETWIIHLGVLLIALAMMKGWARLQPPARFVGEREPPPWRPRAEVDLLLSGGLLGVGALVLLYSGFLTHPWDLGDMLRGLAPWLKTGADGHGHDKPPYYWLTLMGRYEFLVAMGFLAALPLLWRTSSGMRFFGLNGVGTFLAYSIVPYKTPWCILSFLWALCFVAGYACERLLRASAPPRRRGSRWRYPLLALAGALVLATLARSVELSFHGYDREDEPYVYVSGKRSLNRFLGRLDAICAAEPRLQDVEVAVYLESYWPMPWLLGRWTHVAYPGKEIPKQVQAQLILVDAGKRWWVEKGLSAPYYVEQYEMRGSQEPFLVYYSERFARHLPPDTERVQPLPRGNGR